MNGAGVLVVLHEAPPDPKQWVNRVDAALSEMLPSGSFSLTVVSRSWEPGFVHLRVVHDTALPSKVLGRAMALADR